MLEEAHKALEAMNAASTAIKDESWGDANAACLHQVQETVGRLLREVGEKSREVMMVPTPDKGDRG